MGHERTCDLDILGSHPEPVLTRFLENGVKNRTVLNGIKKQIILTKVTYHYKPVITVKSYGP